MVGKDDSGKIRAVLLSTTVAELLSCWVVGFFDLTGVGGPFIIGKVAKVLLRTVWR